MCQLNWQRSNQVVHARQTWHVSENVVHACLLFVVESKSPSIVAHYMQSREFQKAKLLCLSLQDKYLPQAHFASSCPGVNRHVAMCGRVKPWEQSDSESSETITDSEDEEVLCYVCQVFMRRWQWEAHRRSESHQRQSREYEAAVEAARDDVVLC